MTREEAIQQLNALIGNKYDNEYNHIEADEILCKLLESLGYGDVVAVWEKIKKWYA